MRLAVPDLVSNSYFAAIAAIELGYMRDEGLDVELELRFPVTDAAIALSEGEIDFLAGCAHAPFYADPRWGDTRLLASLAHRMYWFLVVRPDLNVTRETLASLRDVRIGAAPGPDLGLRRLLEAEGVDLSRVTITPVPNTAGNVSFGVTAAQALRNGDIDAFWANGMGTEVAVRTGAGKVIVDARREGGDAALFTFPALMASGRMIREQPDATAAAVRGIMRAQNELRQDTGLATKVGDALFPAMEAGLIAGLIERDLDFYDPSVSHEAVAGLTAFARTSGLADRDLGYDDVVAECVRSLWEGR